MNLDRYSRQVALPEIGETGQRQLRLGRGLILGCGALGTAVADALARAGVGFLRLADRDFVDLHDLHRQMLYTEKDARERLPKAIAAADALKRANSEVQVDPRVVDAESGNLTELLRDVDVVVDGTDNMETRFALNTACVERRVPWVYGAAVGTHGMAMTFHPGKGPCLQCLVPRLPAPGTLATCETAGVLPTLTRLVASVQATLALKILLGSHPETPELLTVDLWKMRWESTPISRDPQCPVCVKRKGGGVWSRTEQTTTLCGRNAFQVAPAEPMRIALSDLAKRLQSCGEVLSNDFLLGLRVGHFDITVFPDGRAIIKGASTPAEARALYSRFVGT